MSDSTPSPSIKKWPLSLIISSAAGLILVLAVGWISFEWMINRITVPPGKSLRLRYSGPPIPLLPGANLPIASNGFAKVDEYGNPLEKGVLADLRGPGRHFYCPFWWERELVDDIVIEPGSVGVVTSKIGKELPSGFLVDGDLGETEHKGAMRKVFGPGRYRVNDYAYEFKIITLETKQTQGQVRHSGWVSIPTGYVGVVTNKSDNPATGAKKGIQDNVLPPGIYLINPLEQQIDIVEIGYREESIKADLVKDANGNLRFDQSGEPTIANNDTGISFPSNDGFKIVMDFTAIWGIMPNQAANVIRKFGNVQAVETKVVVPQIQSICRNMGSKLGAQELLVGDTRQSFQTETSEEFRQVLNDKDVTLLYGLVRHIYIPQEVRVPIQLAFIADELKLTRDQEQLTAQTEATLREAEQKVELEAERIRVETEKLVAEEIAKGDKTAKETVATTQQLVAAIDKQTAALEAQATVILGEAKAQSETLQKEAEASRFIYAVAAFGSGQSFNQWVFATGLPDDIELNMLYAGEGTFWTDLKGFTETLLGKQQAKSR